MATATTTAGYVHSHLLGHLHSRRHGFPHIREQYDLDNKAYTGYVWLDIRKAIYGLPHAGILANKQLRSKLKPHGYYEVPHTPGL